MLKNVFNTACLKMVLLRSLAKGTLTYYDHRSLAWEKKKKVKKNSH